MRTRSSRLFPAALAVAGLAAATAVAQSPPQQPTFRSGVDLVEVTVVATDKDGNPVTAPWHNGKAAMIGKSYDGTLANGVAATGVEGLTTIVPISAISQWYEYSRTGGIRHNGDYPGNSLAPAITNPDRLATCAASRKQMNNDDGDEHGDVNQFWLDRDHLQDVGNVRASVFITHGTQDDNVRFNLTIDNLFDKQPPEVGNDIGSTTLNSGNTFPQFYDVVGRFYTLGVTVTF